MAASHSAARCSGVRSGLGATYLFAIHLPYFLLRFAALFSHVSVDTDALEVRIANPLLEPLLQLTAWEEAFSQRLLVDEAKNPSNPSSNGGSKSGDIFQHTLSSLATHAAAHGFSFLRSSKDDGMGEVTANLGQSLKLATLGAFRFLLWWVLLQGAQRQIR